MGETARQGFDLGPLLLLTEDELRDFAKELSEITSHDVIVMDEVKTLVANWAATIRLRRHPQFQENTNIYRHALATGEFYEGLPPEKAEEIKPPW